MLTKLKKIFCDQTIIFFMVTKISNFQDLSSFFKNGHL
jgi:hypothetical protein